MLVDLKESYFLNKKDNIYFWNWLTISYVGACVYVQRFGGLAGVCEVRGAGPVWRGGRHPDLQECPATATAPGLLQEM